MKFIIGKKIEMTQIWRGEEVVAVTKVQADPCTVVQVKTADVDGYSAVQLGFGVRKEKNINKPQKGHFKGLKNFAKLKEFRIEANEADNLKRGDLIGVESFVAGDKVQATGTSKGKGFQGVVKRYGFSGSKKTHGNKDQLRMPGSVGATGPAHVFKGTRMGGRMGGDQVTTKNLEVVEVDETNNLIYIKGAVSGARNSLVLISGEGELKVMETKTEEAQKIEDKKAEGEEENNKEHVTSNIKQEERPEEEKAEPEVKEAKKEEKKSETPEEVEKEVVEAKEKVDQKDTKEIK